GLATLLALFDRLSFVVLPLAVREPELDLGAAADVEIEAKRNQRQAFFTQLPHEAIELAAMHEELAAARRLVVLPRRRIVRADVHVHQHELAAMEAREAVFQIGAAVAQRLHFAAGQHEPRLERLVDEVVVPRLAIDRDVARLSHRVSCGRRRSRRRRLTPPAAPQRHRRYAASMATPFFLRMRFSVSTSTTSGA